MTWLRALSALLVAGCAYGTAYSAMVSQQGTWSNTLQARDLDGSLSNGAEAYYDTALNITWLAWTSTDYGSAFGNAQGRVTGQQAIDWVNGLSFVGAGDWRLPKTVPGTEPLNLRTYFNGTADYGYWGTASEMGHLYYVTLGNAAECPYASYSTCTSLPIYTTTAGLTNTGPYRNLQSGYYLSGTPYTDHPPGYSMWVFSMRDGLQDYCVGCGPLAQDASIAAWEALVVHDGDVGRTLPSPVPLPAAASLFTLGLAAFTFAFRRRRTC